MAEVTVEEIADAMYDLVKSAYGKKDLKPMDVTKAMIQQFGDEEVDKRMCKKALRILIDSQRCIYKYAGGSYVTLPEGS
uniref:DsrD n=1 Tax=uncultured sulfate-reducing bacterium TaxID=153939 RepID=Q3IBT0_9BACT|nr:dsrD [uncultured sulfate-reducing bacterium]